MLIDLLVRNFKSIRDEAFLTLVAQDKRSPDPRYKVLPAGQDFSLLTASLVYGPNASGKSNLLEALKVLADLVQESGAYTRNQTLAGIVPFRLDEESSQKPTVFELEFLAAGQRYRYRVEADRQKIHQERLETFNGSKKALLFHRQAEELEFGVKLTGKKKAIEVWPNTLYLSRAALSNHEQLMPVYSWFNFPVQRPLGGQNRWNKAAEVALSTLDEGSKPWIEAFLRAADLGVEGFDVVSALGGGRIEFRHRSGDQRWKPLSLEEESSGTVNLFSSAFLLVKALRSGTLIVMDELESGIHPALVQAVLELFRDPLTNPKGAQILMTSHTPSLLDPQIVRRDQIWFTEKDSSGATTLFSLQDFDKNEIRAESPFEKLYLSGKLGAVPQIRLSEIWAQESSDAP